MRTLYWISMLLMILSLSMFTGCTIIWLDDMLYVSAFKKIEFDEIIKDANSITIRMYRGKPQEIDAKTPYGFLTTKNEEPSDDNK